MTDVIATYDIETDEFLVRPLTTRAFGWFSDLFKENTQLADGSQVIKSLNTIRATKLKIELT